MNLSMSWRTERFVSWFVLQGWLIPGIVALALVLGSCGLPTGYTYPATPVWTQESSNQYILSASLSPEIMTKGVYLYYSLIKADNTSINTKLAEIQSEWSSIGTSTPETFIASTNRKYTYQYVSIGNGNKLGGTYNPTISIGTGDLRFSDTGDSDYSFAIQLEKNATAEGLDCLYCIQETAATKKLELLRTLEDGAEFSRLRFDVDNLSSSDSDVVKEAGNAGNWYLVLIATSYYFTDDLNATYSYTPAVITAAIDLEG